MADRIDEPVLPFNSFSDLEKNTFNFSDELSAATVQARVYARAASGPIERGKVHLDEFSQSYLKTHKVKPDQEIVRKTSQGELHLHFDKDGLPASADLLAKDGVREHVTTDPTGKVMSDDIFNAKNVRTSHLGFDAGHQLTEENIDSQQFDEANRYLGPIHLAYKFDAQHHLTYAHSDYPDGVEDLHNEPGSKTIVTTNPSEGTDKDTYNYNLKTNRLDNLDFIDQHGNEFVIKRGPKDSLDITPLTRI